MKKLKKIITFSALLSIAISSLAQEKGKVTVTTIYDEPKKNIWNVGIVLAGFDIQNQTSGGLYYMVHGRYTLGKLFTFTANASLDLTKLIGGDGIIKTGGVYTSLNPYSHFEGRASFHFSDREGKLTNKVKLGQGIENIGGVSHTVKYSTTYESKVRNIYALTASINLHNQTGVQVDDSAADKRALTMTDAQGNDVGFKSQSAVNQKNIIIGVGLFIGYYTHFKGKFTGGTLGSKTRKIKKSTSSAIELLIGTSMNMGNKVYWKDNNDVIQTYNLKTAETKRLGWRITTDYGRNKVGLYQHFELGMRPGLFAPSRQKSWLNQGYISVGYGFGF
ncbi:MAG: hypothetical protein ACKVQB_12775 [Bacteroidia bacterium]